MAAPNTPFDKIYLDNNATTRMPEMVQQEIKFWSNRGNASAGYESAEACRRLMSEFRRYIGAITQVNVCCDEDRDSDPEKNYADRRDGNLYKIIFTSGASESNSTAITGAVNAAHKSRNLLSPLPNIVIGATEHKSIIKCAESLEEQGRATLTKVQPNVRGIIEPEAVARAISPFTCIVCVMAANNETGAIADIGSIYEICKRRGVHYHCDAVQIFGKFVPLASYTDSMSVSFHKIHGPPGVGLLIIKQSSPFEPLIHGSQNEGLRGGTENIPGIAASFLATRYTLTHRREKNTGLLVRKRYLMAKLAEQFPVFSYEQYTLLMARQRAYEQTGYTVHDVLPQVAARALVDAGLAAPKLSGVRFPKIFIVFISTIKQCLPNTILLSVVKHSSPAICNSEIKKQLESEGVIVSIGSACNTADPKASHVLYALGADQYVRQGCLRISLGDDTTTSEVNAFIDKFCRIVHALSYL